MEPLKKLLAKPELYLSLVVVALPLAAILFMYARTLEVAAFTAVLKLGPSATNSALLDAAALSEMASLATKAALAFVALSFVATVVAVYVLRRMASLPVSVPVEQ